MIRFRSCALPLLAKRNLFYDAKARIVYSPSHSKEMVTKPIKEIQFQDFKFLVVSETSGDNLVGYRVSGGSEEKINPAILFGPLLSLEPFEHLEREQLSFRNTVMVGYSIYATSFVGMVAFIPNVYSMGGIFFSQGILLHALVRSFFSARRQISVIKSVEWLVHRKSEEVSEIFDALKRDR